MTVAAPPLRMRDKINAMLIKDIRKELESYGVSAEGIFEKKELVEALVKARQEEIIPDYEAYERQIAENEYYDNSSKKDSKSWFKPLEDVKNVVEQFSSKLNGTRKEKIKQEFTNLKDAKLKDLKKELESYGVSTKGFFEKRDFVQAVSEARVDGVNKKSSASASSSNRDNRDEWDPAYKNVFVTRFDASSMDPSGVIDVRGR